MLRPDSPTPSRRSRPGSGDRRVRYHEAVSRPRALILFSLLSCVIACDDEILDPAPEPVIEEPIAYDKPEPMQGPAATPVAGEIAPDFELPRLDGTIVRLSDVVTDADATILVFYRGHW